MIKVGIALVVVSCLLGTSALADPVVYEWNPNAGCQGVGRFVLSPLGADATESNFGSATILDFSFVFGNGVRVTLSDIAVRELPGAAGGVLVDLRLTSADFSDTLVFAAGSADYRPGPSFADWEVNGGSWILVSAPVTAPEPSCLLLLGGGLISLGILRRTSPS